jgi:hypothetical protein
MKIYFFHFGAKFILAMAAHPAPGKFGVMTAWKDIWNITIQINKHSIIRSALPWLDMPC